MRSRSKANKNPLTTQSILDIHSQMGGQLLAYMSPEDAFATVERYIAMLRANYEPSTLYINRKGLLQHLEK